MNVWLISVHSDSAAAVTAFDLTFTGTFAQVQCCTFGLGPPTPLRRDNAVYGPSVFAQDTHFVPDLITTSPPLYPTEGVSLTYAVGLADDLISNPVALPVADQSPSVLVAQIVIPVGPPGVQASFAGEVTIEGNPVPVPISGEILLPVPEPSCLLLTTALLAVLACCRLPRASYFYSCGTGDFPGNSGERRFFGKLGKNACGGRGRHYNAL